MPSECGHAAILISDCTEVDLTFWLYVLRHVTAVWVMHSMASRTGMCSVLES